MLQDLSSDVADAKRFYKFVQKIHTEYRALQRGVPSTMLTEERVAQLQNVGFEFSTNLDRSVPDLDWSTRIQQLEAFQSEMGHLRVDPCICISKKSKTSAQHFRFLLRQN